jgi:methylmalonyl-CoA/ethylmalonyl-CoA epimerase
MPEQMYPKLHHVGIVVRDIDRAGSDNSAYFGLGDLVGRFTMQTDNALYRGKRVSYGAEFGFIELGNTLLELIQPVGSDPSPYFDALSEHGEMTHHLAYVVPSINEHLDTARKAGASPSILLEDDLPKGDGRFAYVEGLVHGVLVELIELQGS